VRGKQYVEVSQYSLTREAYQFWKLLDEQQTRTGSLFDPQPAPMKAICTMWKTKVNWL
jgi:hypothetical protein